MKHRIIPSIICDFICGAFLPVDNQAVLNHKIPLETTTSIVTGLTPVMKQRLMLE